MDVFFEPQGGSPFSIEVGYFDRVAEIKEKIEKYQHIPLSKQILIFNGKVLHDDLDVEQCQILHNSRIQLYISDHYYDHNGSRNRNHHHHHQTFKMEHHPPLFDQKKEQNDVVSINCKGKDSRKIRLTVVPKCGTRKIQVEVNAADNVRELRKELSKIHQRLEFALPQEGYFFIYKQNVMDDDRSFRWHNVDHGDTIEIFNGSVSGGS